MLRVRIKEKGASFELHWKGHAGFAERGQDIVCSAASILLYTLIESINNKDLIAPMSVVIGNGEAVVRIIAKSENIEKIRGSLIVIATGYRLLAENFKENVNFSWVGGREEKNALLKCK
jgi:uncharacterized protein YsxB (DUF464 family)